MELKNFFKFTLKLLVFLFVLSVVITLSFIFGINSDVITVTVVLLIGAFLFLLGLRKTVFWLSTAAVGLAGGAFLETRFPEQAVTEAWGVFMIVLFTSMLMVAWRSFDREKAIKYLSKTGLYDVSKLLTMKQKELLLRSRLHKRDNSTDWSARSFTELLASEEAFRVAEREHSRALLGAFTGASAEEQTCRNCGHRVSSWSKSKLHPGVFQSTPCERMGKFCVPIGE